MNMTVDAGSDQQHSLQRSTILRVYNYYRILISFLFLFLFLDLFPNASGFIGTVMPDLFRPTIVGYVTGNILIGLATLFIRAELLARTGPSFVILVLDIICINLMMTASGGVNSGLGNFLIFTVAFGGGLILGRVSTVLPAIAFILLVYGEVYLFFRNVVDFQSLFQSGVLGAALFGSNILFQFLSRQLRRTETEVFTLEKINQLVVDQMRTGVVVVGSDGEIRLINASAKDQLEIPAEPDIPYDKLPFRLADKLNAWKQDKSLADPTFHTHDAGPELIAHFSELVTPESTSETLIFIEDSTDVQRQAQQLKLASLGRLSATIAHEIRNPLSAISTASQLLAESEDLPKGDKRLTEIIQHHVIRLNGVVENVLQMSRRKSAEPVMLNLETWLPAFLEEFSAGMPDAIDVSLNVEPDLTVSVDRLHLSQVLGNLCQNGLRYSEKETGEPKIVINAGTDPHLGNSYIEVIDYGKGVNEEVLPNLFEPFNTSEVTGTGLGLYLSKELCEANNARLGYRQADTGGACFYITFFAPSHQ